jgi:uncharacterized protein
LSRTPERNRDPFQVVAFTVATLSPVALLFATLWARTRSLLLIVLLHAAVDVLPNLPDFVRTWPGRHGQWKAFSAH